MKATTKKEIKTKSGEVLPKGSPVTFRGLDEGNSFNSSLCLVQGLRAEPYKVRITSAFKSPSMNKLEEWANDGVCESILGERVEPDGCDEYGSPSWLLALGLI